MTETITVVGNITQPEFRTTPSGVPIVNFRIATTERRFDKVDDKWVDASTSWYSVSAFRRLADHAHRSFRKGDRVVVTGRLRVRDWETAAKKGVTAEIDADAMGHDLLWGVTTFHRDGGHPSTVVEASATADGQSAGDGWDPTSPDAWRPAGIGGSDAPSIEDDLSDAVPETADRPLALVGGDAPF